MGIGRLHLDKERKMSENKEKDNAPIRDLDGLEGLRGDGTAHWYVI